MSRLAGEVLLSGSTQKALAIVGKAQQSHQDELNRCDGCALLAMPSAF
jgi:hypothetical protein